MTGSTREVRFRWRLKSYLILNSVSVFTFLENWSVARQKFSTHPIGLFYKKWGSLETPTLYWSYLFTPSYPKRTQAVPRGGAINPLTPRCAEFSRWLECRTIYRKKMKKDRKLHILPFLWSLFRMAQSEFSKNHAKPFIFPKIPKKNAILGVRFFFNLNFHYVSET